MSLSTRTEAMCLTSHLSFVPVVDWETEIETATNAFCFYSPQCRKFKGAICDFHRC